MTREKLKNFESRNCKNMKILNRYNNDVIVEKIVTAYKVNDKDEL